MNFAFVNIFYLPNVPFSVDNVKTINGTYSPTIKAEDFSNYGQEVFISVSVTPENTKSAYSAKTEFSISQNYLFQFL